MESSAATLVTGCSGVLGRHLLRELASRRQSIVALYYHRLPETMPNIFPVCSDMSSAELLAAPLRGVETVVHMAWEGSLVGNAKPGDHWDADSLQIPKNVAITRNLVHAMERAGTKRLVFISALGAARDAATSFLKEKYLAEFLALNSKIPEVLVVRPTLFYSDDFANERFFQVVSRYNRWPLLTPIPFSKQSLNPLHVDDLVGILLPLMQKEWTEPRGIIELDGSRRINIPDVFKLAAHQVNNKNRIFVGGFVGKAMAPLLGREPKAEAGKARLRDYLALSVVKSEALGRENSFAELVPKPKRHFADAFNKNKTPAP